jgi:hypothetical protein
MPRKPEETEAEYHQREISELVETGSRYERALRAIATCPLTYPEFGDYVQSVCEDLLEGGEAECWNCGTAVHDGPCVGDGSGLNHEPGCDCESCMTLVWAAISTGQGRRAVLHGSGALQNGRSDGRSGASQCRVA